MRRSTLVRAVAGMAAAAALVPAAPAGAIVGGTPDFDHPSVGLVRFTTAEGRFRCSGTLIAPKVVLTAGHCTEGPATDVVVSFSQKLLPDPLRTRDFSGYITGTAHPDPGWDGKLQFAKQHDQGVVVLDKAAPVAPAQLPPLNFLGANASKLKSSTFTLVGYGVDIALPGKDQIVNDQRYKTTSTLKNVGDEVITFEVNSNNALAEGGSCFGDSGGGVFLGNVVLGDASYVNSLKCNGVGSYQRDDTTYSRAFLSSFLG